VELLPDRDYEDEDRLDAEKYGKKNKSGSNQSESDSDEKSATEVKQPSPLLQDSPSQSPQTLSTSNPSSQTNASAGPLPDSSAVQQQSALDDNQLEAHTQNFESMFETVRNVRQQAGSLPDSVRRQRAADAIMSLLGSLGDLPPDIESIEREFGDEPDAD